MEQLIVLATPKGPESALAKWFGAPLPLGECSCQDCGLVDNTTKAVRAVLDIWKLDVPEEQKHETLKSIQETITHLLSTRS